jgi:hypothetical protein
VPLGSIDLVFVLLLFATCKSKCIFQLANFSQEPQPTSLYALLSINIICSLHDTFHLPRKCFFEALLLKAFSKYAYFKIETIPFKNILMFQGYQNDHLYH